MLVPVGDCVFGIDCFIAGARNAGVNWLGAPGRTRLELSPRPASAGDRLPSGASRVIPAVPTGDGTVIGIGHYVLPPQANGTDLWIRR